MCGLTYETRLERLNIFLSVCWRAREDLIQVYKWVNWLPNVAAGSFFNARLVRNLCGHPCMYCNHQASTSLKAITRLSKKCGGCYLTSSFPSKVGWKFICPQSSHFLKLIRLHRLATSCLLNYLISLRIARVSLYVDAHMHYYNILQ